MRVALVCPYSLDRPGGVATHVLGLAAWLRGQGHRAVVIAPGTGPAGSETVLVGPATSLRFNGSTAQLALGRTQARAAVRALTGADVVHVHEPLTPGIAFAAARAAGGRLVVTHHAHYTATRLAPLLRLRSGRLPPRISIAVSPAAAETARAATGADPQIIPNAITLPAPSTPPANPRPRVTFLGRLDEPRKGYATFTRLAADFPGADFVAVGPGRGGAAAVSELGQVSDELRTEVLNGTDVLVAPNLYGESFGMILVEALAHGCSLVASDLAPFRAVVDDPALVSWFAPGDDSGARDALRLALSRPRGGGAARRAAQMFSWSAVGPAVLAAYRRQLG